MVSENLDLGIQKRQWGGYISINRPIFEHKPLPYEGSGGNKGLSIMFFCAC